MVLKRANSHQVKHASDANKGQESQPVAVDWHTKSEVRSTTQVGDGFGLHFASLEVSGGGCRHDDTLAKLARVIAEVLRVLPDDFLTPGK